MSDQNNHNATGLPTPTAPSGTVDTEIQTPATENKERQTRASDSGVRNIIQRWKREDMLKKGCLGLRGIALIFSLLALIIMASNKHGDWRDFDKYEEYRYIFDSSSLSENMCIKLDMTLASDHTFWIKILKIYIPSLWPWKSSNIFKFLRFKDFRSQNFNYFSSKMHIQTLLKNFSITSKTQIFKFQLQDLWLNGSLYFCSSEWIKLTPNMLSLPLTTIWWSFCFCSISYMILVIELYFRKWINAGMC